MLNGVLTLGDVDDVERYLRSALTKRLKQRHMHLTHEAADELLADLFVEAWRLWRNHDDTRSQFSSRLYAAVSYTVAGHARRQVGRYFPTPNIESLDEPDRHPRQTRHLEAIADRDGGLDVGSLAQRGLLNSRSRADVRRHLTGRE